MFLRNIMMLLGIIAGCNPVSPSKLSVDNDGGTCEGIWIPFTCDRVKEVEEQLEDRLPCNTCVAYRCECTEHTFCKICPGQDDWQTDWGCTPLKPAYCLDF